MTGLKAYKTVLRSAFLLLVMLLLSRAGLAQEDAVRPPDRGLQSGQALSISDFENINLTNGNVMLNFPLASLPAGRGSVSAGISLRYDSKLYDTRIDKSLDSSNRLVEQVFLNKSSEGGWHYSLNYDLRVLNRNQTSDSPYQHTTDEAQPDYRGLYIWKLKMYFPDGSSHEFRPTGYSDYFSPSYGPQPDGYYNVSPLGEIRTCSWQYVSTGYDTPNMPPFWVCHLQISYDPSPYMTYYSTDGTYTRLRYNRDGSWVLFFPGGNRVEQDAASGEQRIYDPNNNFVRTGTVTLPDGSQGFGWIDAVGRYVVKQHNQAANEDYIISQGVSGEIVRTTVKWKATCISRPYRTLGVGGGRSRGSSSNQVYRGGFSSVESITLPQQRGSNLRYAFTYYGADVLPPAGSTDYTEGWGEIKKVTTPTSANATYDYTDPVEGQTTILPNPNQIIKRTVMTKTLRYDAEYDQQLSPVSEVTNYDITSTVTTVYGPDGSVTSEVHGDTDYEHWLSGLLISQHRPDGSVLENLWAQNVPVAGLSAGRAQDLRINQYVKTTFTSIADASGTPALTTIKDFDYDKNGNLIRVAEYDFVPYSSIPRDNLGRVTGIPSGIFPTRVTESVFYYATPTATDQTTNPPYSYWNAGAPAVRNAVAATEIKNSSGQPVSRAEFYYDGGSATPTVGNLTETKVWDSYKGGQARALTAPLTSDNSVSTSATYNQYGMPLTATDADGNVTQITYGAVAGPGGAAYDLYPTQTVQAYNTPVARTSSAVYDFHTGAATTTTDVDNNLSTITEYDDLGRPTRVRSAANTALESWTRTEYDDSNRRVVARADIETIGDGRKVATQFYDQLGRVRLSKTLEDAATQSATNETDGIKVQTRYLTGNPNSYRLTSNPYRANYSSNETDATMGWTRSKAVNTDRHSEVETFSGASLPAPWGTNASSTGVVTTDVDADRTLVTDQAGKQRISRINALGQLKDIWEVTAADSTTEAISFPNQTLSAGFRTSYSYDTLNSLTTVNQGVQTRTFSYSSLSRLLSATNPESGMINYVYDSNGNLTRKTDARGVETDYVYDALNRVTNRNYSLTGSTPPNYQATPNVEYFYDNLPNARGKLIKVTNGTGVDRSTTEYTAFDILGRVTAHKQTTDGNAYTTAYSYNLSGALINETYPSGRVVTNTLNANGDLAQAQSQKNATDILRTYANDFAYTAAGAVSSMKLGNGKFENTQYNSRLQPTQIGLGSSASTQNLLKLNYDYGSTDNNGNVKSQTITTPTVGSNLGFVATQNYSYDSLNRLKSAVENITGQTPPSWKQTFIFDRYGNRNFDAANTTTIPPGCSVAVCNPSVDPTTNKLVGYQFDGAGNTKVDATGQTFIYDSENKQVQVNNSNGTVSQYFYDGDGKRIKKYVPSTGETTVFVSDAAGKEIAEYSTIVSNSTDAKVNYLTSDNLGSPRITTDALGQVISRRDFMPFGEEVFTAQRTQALGYTADTVRQKFTAYERDNETDLDYAQARMYGNSHGRFTSPDPTLLSVNAYTPQSWNRYTYVLNNPYLYTDPLGLWEVTTETVCKKNDDGSCKTYKNGEVKVDKVIVTARKTKDDDDGASLAKQLGLTGKDATKFAERIGDGNNIRLSDQGGIVGRVFGEVESGLAQQANWRNENKEKLAELAAKDKYGPGGNDCSGTTCRIGLGDNVPLIGTNVLDARLETEARNITESEAQIGDIIRYAKANNVATHFANFIFRNDDGTPIAFSKSGVTGPYEIRSAASLQVPNYGTIRGINKDPSGYYRRR